MAYTNTINDPTPMAEYAEAVPVEDHPHDAKVPEPQQPVYGGDYPTSYLISNDWWGGGNADITCQTTKEVMFQMVRMGGSVLRHTNILSIQNMAGQPVLSL